MYKEEEARKCREKSSVYAGNTVYTDGGQQPLARPADDIRRTDLSTQDWRSVSSPKKSWGKPSKDAGGHRAQGMAAPTGPL